MPSSRSVTGALTPTSAAEYRCAIAWRSRGRAIALTVVLPPDEVPAGADFPRLAWTSQDRRWIGTASLPSAPAFVRVARSGSPALRRARLLDAAALFATAVAMVWTIVYTIRSGRADVDPTHPPYSPPRR